MVDLLDIALATDEPLPADLLESVYTDADARQDTARISTLRRRSDLPAHLRPADTRTSARALAAAIKAGEVPTDDLVTIVADDTRPAVLTAAARRDDLDSATVARLAASRLPPVAAALVANRDIALSCPDVKAVVADTLWQRAAEAGQATLSKRSREWLTELRQADASLASDHVPLPAICAKEHVTRYTSTTERAVRYYHRIAQLLADRATDGVPPGANRAVHLLGAGLHDGTSGALEASDWLVGRLPETAAAREPFDRFVRLVAFCHEHGPIGTVLTAGTLEQLVELDRILTGRPRLAPHGFGHVTASNPNVPDERLLRPSPGEVFPKLYASPARLRQLLDAGRVAVCQQLAGRGANPFTNHETVGVLRSSLHLFDRDWVCSQVDAAIGWLSSPTWKMESPDYQLRALNIVDLAARYELLDQVSVPVLRQVIFGRGANRGTDRQQRAAGAVVTALPGYFADPVRRQLFDELSLTHEGTVGELLTVIDTVAPAGPREGNVS